MERPTEVACATAEIDMHAYYDSFDDANITNRFQDLDSPTSLSVLMQHVQSSTSRTFVLDFNDNAAYAAFNLPTASLAQLLMVERPETSSARWINMWNPYHQQPLLSLLAKRYDFSPRLLGMMCSDPCVRRSPPRQSRASIATGKAPRHARAKNSNARSDVERGWDELSDTSSSSVGSYDSVAGGNLYRIVDDLWHYSSVDFGRSYVCIGYNSLYGTKPAGLGQEDGPLPHCIRVWTWLLLCESNTVISINEDPFPYAEGQLDGLQQRILQETRRNLVKVFRSLSRVDEATRLARSPTRMLPLRTRLGDTPEETAYRESDTTGLLFYYLFENFHNSYTLVTRRESRYGELRAEMFESPKLRHIDRLGSIGKELGVLRRHYQSYLRIIDRLLEPQPATSTPLQPPHNLDAGSETCLKALRPLPPLEPGNITLGISLTPASLVRFQRLRDLIALYALSEIDEYTTQKDALVTLNFNLLALRDTLAMEKLTKVALLITKATLLFLPVSLMSAYFGLSLGGGEYTVVEYWLYFAVVLVCSWVGLVGFGVINGSAQTVDFLRGLWAGVRRIWKR
ncbi:hypothetical protein LTR54_008853 [Friedmanniomyces endolithicus]|nr:hypothetical protein LTS00_015917 [Friedmanniomyces endolithicus]KAK1000626.1 hypothetical protein LTR54_008853 [Friedmanniomyces endolithicus]